MSKTVEAINTLFAKRKPAKDGAIANNLKPIYCADGTSLSVQASRMHYCFPRNNEGPYNQVEVGFPSSPPPEMWRDMCEGDFDLKPCDTVYSRVPLDAVAKFIDMHGGIRAEEAPKLVLPEPSAPIKREGIQAKRYNLTLEDMGVKL